MQQLAGFSIHMQVCLTHSIARSFLSQIALPLPENSTHLPPLYSCTPSLRTGLSALCPRLCCPQDALPRRRGRRQDFVSPAWTSLEELSHLQTGQLRRQSLLCKIPLVCFHGCDPTRGQPAATVGPGGILAAFPGQTSSAPFLPHCLLPWTQGSGARELHFVHWLTLHSLSSLLAK